MRDVLIGIDAGTSVIKSVAFDLGGRQIAACAIPNSYESEGGKGVVQDLNRTWRDAARTLSDLAGKVENLASRVAAISVTGSSPPASAHRMRTRIGLEKTRQISAWR